jgi:hypothetical protein
MKHVYKEYIAEPDREEWIEGDQTKVCPPSHCLYQSIAWLVYLITSPSS